MKIENMRDFKQFLDEIKPTLKAKLQSTKILTLFAQNYASFEGWLKVELCEILKGHFDQVEPEYRLKNVSREDVDEENDKENSKIDIRFSNQEQWGIEIKVITTGYKIEGIPVKKGRSIAGKKTKIENDIKKLNSSVMDIKLILIVVYPTKGDLFYKNHVDKNNIENTYKKIEDMDIKELKRYPFKFHDEKTQGTIYFGLV